jgi:hypothetical protein
MTIKALYPNVRPTLNLDFAKTKALDPRVTFTRASTATFVGSNGLIQTAASGAARFDQNYATGESLGLLVEEARTNRALYSEQFDNGWWIKYATTVSANATTAPDGTATADKLISLSTSNRFCVYNYSTITANTVQTFSCYGKSAGWDFMTLAVGKAGPPYTRDAYTINLSNGTVNKGPWGSATALSTAFTKESLANNWWKLSVSVLIDSSSTDLHIEIGTSPTNQYNNGMPGDGTSGIYIWGAQLETGSFPTSYIPTSGATATRAADVATLANTGSSIFPVSAFTTVNSPFGTAGGGTTVKLVGPTVKRTAVYNGDLTQSEINALAGVNDGFWRWRVLGTSFALPNFTTNGSVTVDWGDGAVETLTTAVHTFTNGGGYHDIGFRLNSGTFFRPAINSNATYKNLVIALGPAPASMKVDASLGFYGCSALKSFDATLDATGGTSFSAAWTSCSNLASFPLINTAAVTSFSSAWYACSGLTSFPLIDTAAGTNFQSAWQSCSSLTSFPLINTVVGTNFINTWSGCSSLTSFPLINPAAGTNFQSAWQSCSGLTSFPLINTVAGINFQSTWFGCSSLTSFPLIDTAAGTNFLQTWYGCSSLTSFPLINTGAGTNFSSAWYNCSSLTSFPLINTAAGTNFQSTWENCTNLTSFPLINTAAGTNFSRAWLNCTNLSSFSLINTAAGTNFQSTWQGLSLLTSFPLVDTSAGTNFRQTWYGCSGLTSFPLINTAAGTNFQNAWQYCSSLTSFPLIDTAAGTNFAQSWYDCSNLTSFPLINTAAGTSFYQTWVNCSGLTSFPLINTAAGTDFRQAWQGCTNLSSFPANMFDATGTLIATAFTNTFLNCALTATSIENILTSLVTNGQSNITLGLSGGTNAGASTWTANAVTAYNTLISRGWTITRNA